VGPCNLERTEAAAYLGFPVIAQEQLRPGPASFEPGHPMVPLLSSLYVSDTDAVFPTPMPGPQLCIYITDTPGAEYGCVCGLGDMYKVPTPAV
jgi:hypothetical protein